jgi:hypothetical protein
MRKLAILVALALVAGLMALGRGQVLADDPIDCSDPANAELDECDPTSEITLTSPQDGATVAPGATIDWTASAICKGPTATQCENAGSLLNGPVPDGYIVRIIGPRNSCNQSATTPLIDEVTTSGGIATGTFTAPSSPGTYWYHAEHPAQQNLAGATWPDAQSNCISITVANVSGGTSAITTEVHDAGHNDITNSSVPLGSVVHDKATVTTTGNSIPTGSTVTFQFFANGECSGDPSSEETVALNGGSFSESVESSDTGPLAAGSYSYKAKFNSGDTSKVPHAESDCEPFTVLKADPTVTTAIYLMPGHAVVTSVTMGATIHDDATVTGIAPFTPTGTVTFNLYRSNDCTGTVVQTSTGTLSGSGASATAESSPDYLTTEADIPALSFKASYSGDDNYNPADADCEPLTVLSSIIAFYYEVIDGPDAPSNPGTFNCTLPASEKGSTSTSCPPGTTAASITKGETNTYRLHVVVANYTGVPISEKVQGGLTAAPGAQYSNLQVTCGNAKINVSKSRGGNGNVVVWDSVGDGKTNNPGFTMNPGDVCELTVDITVKFSGTGLQPLTSSWSEFQCLLDGPNAGFCEKSPYTNSLMVVVS